MPDNVGYTPGSGASIAADGSNPDGALRQRVKLQTGVEGSAQDVASGQALPVYLDDMMLRRIVKLLETLSVTDAQQRQRIVLDAISSSAGGASTSLAGTLPTTISSGTVTTVTTISTVTTVTNPVPIGNVATIASMDREMYINIARQAAISQRAQLIPANGLYPAGWVQAGSTTAPISAGMLWSSTGLNTGYIGFGTSATTYSYLNITGISTFSLGSANNAPAYLTLQSNGALLTGASSYGATSAIVNGTASIVGNLTAGSLTSLGGMAVGGALTGATTGNFSGTVTYSASTPIAFSGTGVNTVTSASNSTNSAFVFNANGGTTGDIFDFQLAGTTLASVSNVGTFYSAVAANSGNPALSFPNNAGGSNLTYLQSSSGTTIASIAATTLLVQGVGLGTPALVAVDASGDMGIAGSYYAASHSSLKTDIKNLDFNSIDIIKQTNIIKFKYKNNLDVEHIGFLADEVPDEISPNHDSHDLGRTISITLDALKQVITRVEVLENK